MVGVGEPELAGVGVERVADGVVVVVVRGASSRSEVELALDGAGECGVRIDIIPVGVVVCYAALERPVRMVVKGEDNVEKERGRTIEGAAAAITAAERKYWEFDRSVRAWLQEGEWPRTTGDKPWRRRRLGKSAQARRKQGAKQQQQQKASEGGRSGRPASVARLLI